MRSGPKQHALRWLGPAVLTALALAAARPLDRLGHGLLSAGRPAAAAVLLGEPAWKGLALYRAGRWAAAAVTLGRAGDPISLYNRGNALARLGDYPAAIDAYDAALARDPANDDARANRALLLSLAGPRPAVNPDASGAEGARTLPANVGRPDTPPPDKPNAGEVQGDGLVGLRQGYTPEGGGTAASNERQATRRGSEGQRGRGGGSGAEGAEAGGSRDEAAAGDPPGVTPAGGPRASEARQATEQWVATIPDDPRRNLRIRIAAEYARRAAAGATVPPGDDPW